MPGRPFAYLHTKHANGPAAELHMFRQLVANLPQLKSRLRIGSEADVHFKHYIGTTAEFAIIIPCVFIVPRDTSMPSSNQKRPRCVPRDN